MKTLDIDKYYKQSDEICPIHEINKVIYTIPTAPKTPICPECAKEQLEKANKELAYKGGDQMLAKEGANWFKIYSIVPDKAIKKANFNNFNATTTEEREVKQKAIDIFTKYKQGYNGNSILTGKPGTGKSHLAYSIGLALNSNGAPHLKVIFISMAEMFYQIQNSWNDPSQRNREKEIIDIASQSDILIMDDLGAEVGAIDTQGQQKDWQAKILYKILNKRTDKPTIWTTNLTGNQLQDMYDGKTFSRIARGTKHSSIVFNQISDKRINGIVG